MNILLVEDNIDDQVLFAEMTSNSDINLHIADSVKDAKKIMDKTDINIVFLDLGLYETSGIHTLYALQSAIPNESHTSIVILTGLEDYRVAKEAVQNGCYQFMTKANMSTSQIARIINYHRYSDMLPERCNTAKAV